MFLSLAATLAASGVFVYSNYIFKRELPSNSQELDNFKEDVEKLTALKTYKLDKITTNLISRRTRLRYLNIEIYLQPFKESQIPVIEENEAFIYDTVLNAIGKMEPKDINSLYGRLLFEDSIKKRVNTHIGEPTIKKIFFTDFVIQ